MGLFFLTGGLFLGWSLGANDAANVFGSAVGSRMISFKTAAIICSLFVILGAVIQGEGAAETLESLGTIRKPASGFIITLSAAISVFFMTRSGLPVSTSQAIVGGIIGWNIYTGTPVNYTAVSKIVTSWIACPVISAAFAIILYLMLKKWVNSVRIHVIRLNHRLKILLIIIGAFGSYSLGANNIANITGVFMNSITINELSVAGLFTLSGNQLLFLTGSLAIAAGVISYSRKTMETVGRNLFQLSSEAALIVVLAHSLVLFIFSSKVLSAWIVSVGLPPIPLVPVSSSQAIIGAILGIGFVYGGRGIRFSILGRISIGWLLTPLLAGMITWFSLFFIENVFGQPVTPVLNTLVTG